MGFESEIDVGTTFFVELPEWQEQSGPGPQDDVKNPNRILICEDDRDTARLLQMMLKQGGFDSDIAYSAEEVQDLLRREQYRAITLDIMLPGQDGISLLHDLHANEATRDIPVIVVSAKAGQHGNDLEGGSVVLDWLDKPIDEARLMNALRRVARQGGNKPVILHVEDDADICRVLSGLVGNEAELVAAPTLADAKAKLEAGRFDLIILDLALPDGSGLDLLPFMNERGLATPVMIFSAGESGGEISRQVAAALVKACTSNEVLLATIKQLIGVA